MSIDRHEAIITFKKYDIYTQSFTPKKTKNHLIIFHGLGEHSSCYNHMAESLYEKSIACHSFDFIGHGRSSGQRGYVPKLEFLTELAESVIERKCSEFKFSKYSLFAHSMGGLLALKKIVQSPFSGQNQLILSNPLVRIKLDIPNWKLGLSKNLASLIPRLALGNEIPEGSLTHDEEIKMSYKKDPWRHKKISAKLFTELQDSSLQLQKTKIKISMTTLILLSLSDTVCDPDATQKFAKNFTHLKFDFYPQSGHEIINDLSRNRAFEAITHFIQGVPK